VKEYIRGGEEGHEDERSSAVLRPHARVGQDLEHEVGFRPEFPVDLESYFVKEIRIRRRSRNFTT